jgi:hypothetical protein
LLVLIAVLAFNVVLMALPVVLIIAGLGLWRPWLLFRGRRR